MSQNEGPPFHTEAFQSIREYDSVNKPKHYTFGKYEVIDVLLDWFHDDSLLYNVGKYIARCKHKGNELEDLKKARYYLNRKISKLEGGS